MFSLKRFSGPNPANIDSGTALPNNYGHIRTMKEDLNSGEKESGSEPEPVLASYLESPPLQPIQTEKQTAPAKPDIKQKVPPAPLSPPPQTAKGSESEKTIPNPFGSETFFQTRSPFEEKAGVSAATAQTTAKKPKNILVIAVSFVAFLFLIGGGTYYWWAFIKQPKKEAGQPTQKTTPSSESGQPATAKPNETSGLKYWNLDPETDKVAGKLAIGQYAKNLVVSSPAEKATEIKLLSKDNKPIAPQKFAEIFDFKLPVSVSEKITDEYSLFVTKENDEPRLGAAFKLNQSPELAESLKSEEASVVPGLQSFYLDKIPVATEIVFSSSKYKNADIRYFNFPGSENSSFDYVILSDKQSGYFLFSASRASLRAILDYMSEK